MGIQSVGPVRNMDRYFDVRIYHGLVHDLAPEGIFWTGKLLSGDDLCNYKNRSNLQYNGGNMPLCSVSVGYDETTIPFEVYGGPRTSKHNPLARCAGTSHG